jgi:mono/diheme cytochrome c family protein
MCASFRRWVGMPAGMLVIVAALLSGCGGDGNRPAYEYFPHMMDSPAVKAQEPDDDGIAGRLPVPGTIPQRHSPYPFKGQADAEMAGKALANPLKRTKETLLRGQKVFNTYCIVCHGQRGEGNGNVVPKFPMPPSLQSDKIKNWADGSIFHVITNGQNLMGSYASQISPEDRWAVVHYVRVLQRSLNPTDEDLRELKKKGY